MKCKLSDIFKKKLSRITTLVHDVEWSGITVYNLSGDYKKGFEIKVVDLLPTCISTSSASFNVELTPEIMKWKLMNYKDLPFGLIHSHAHGNVFFSGTDLNEIKDNITFNPDYYVSLVTNSKGDLLVGIFKETNVERIEKIIFDGYSIDKKYTETIIYKDEQQFNSLFFYNKEFDDLLENLKSKNKPKVIKPKKDVDALFPEFKYSYPFDKEDW